mgnify:CR=1 FL=1
MAGEKRKKDKRNPNMTCFCCGKKVINRHSNAFYCSKCSRVVSQIRNRINSTIYNNGLRKMDILKYYDFKITVNIIKKLESENKLKVSS